MDYTNIHCVFYYVILILTIFIAKLVDTLTHSEIGNCAELSSKKSDTL